MNEFQMHNVAHHICGANVTSRHELVLATNPHVLNHLLAPLHLRLMLGAVSQCREIPVGAPFRGPYHRKISYSSRGSDLTSSHNMFDNTGCSGKTAGKWISGLHSVA